VWGVCGGGPLPRCPVSTIICARRVGFTLKGESMGKKATPQGKKLEPDESTRIHWLSIIGKAQVKDGVIRYVPAPAPAGPSAGEPSPAVIRSSLEFENGSLSFEAYLNEPNASCLIGLNQGLEEEVFIGLNSTAGPYGISRFYGGSWESIKGVGVGDKPAIHTWISVRVRALGSNIDLYVNRVKLVSANVSLLKAPVGFLLQSNEEILVRNFSAEYRPPRAFVVMQYSTEFDALFRDVIKPTCERFGFEVIRADDIYRSGLIIEDITTSIREASVVIADITPNNPNVYYEVGYAHAIDKPTILLSDRTREQMPFDVSGFRTLFYDNTIGGKSQVEERLIKHLESMSV